MIYAGIATKVMLKTEYVISLLIFIIVCVWLIWRTASRRRSIPCPAWLSWMVDNPLSMRRTEATISHMRLTPGMDVLDAGCGPGRLSIPIAETILPGGAVLAVDIQIDMLRRARIKSNKSSLTNIEFLHSAIGEGMLPPGRFDRAVLSTVLGEIPDRLGALREIFRSLKPGGFLLVNEVMGDPHYQSLSRVKELATEVGFLFGEYHGNCLAFSIELVKPNEIP